MFQKSTPTLIFLRFTFIHIQVVFIFYSQAYQIDKYNIIFTSINVPLNTRPSHYHISHYIFDLTFRDYCGTNLLLGHQYGSHYLYLNLKSNVVNCSSVTCILGLPTSQPRSQALSSCGAKTLVGAGHVTHRKLIAQEGDGKVSYYMFPLSHFALRLQGVAVLYNHL